MCTTEATQPTTPASGLATMAEHLRDGPLRDLVELQQQATELANQANDRDDDSLQRVAELVRLTLAAQQHFHRFTREFQALTRRLAECTAEETH